MTRRPINYLDDATAQSGDPLTWADIREGIINTFLTPLRWLVRTITAPFRWAWRLFTR